MENQEYMTLQKEDIEPLMSSSTSSFSDNDLYTYQLHNKISLKPELRKFLPWGLHIILLSISVSLLYMSSFMRRDSTEPQGCVQKLSQYSPALGVISEDYEIIRMGGPPAYESPFKGPPNAEVDALWLRFTELGAISITEEEYEGLNASVHGAKIPKALGGGYMALPGFVHQLHCLNYLWQLSWPDYYTGRQDLLRDRPDEFHHHMDHCMDLLRQNLMCTADMSLLTYNWIKHHYQPHLNFNVQRRCRNFDTAMDWALSRRINATGWGRDYFTREDVGGVIVDFDEPPYDPFADS